MALPSGSRLGPYEILAPLGAGGMGEVYRARDPRLGREVAIKVLPADRLADESRRRRFVQEACAASQLSHPGIVTIHEIEREGDVDFIVMELVPGKSLDKLIPRGGMAVDQALRLAIPIADALARAHAAGIVHRDLKPANVVVSGGVPKILDFGLAKLLARDDIADQPTATEQTAAEPLSRTGVVSGTPAYMSPEQAEGREVDARSDVFSFGALLYELVTGRRPFAGGSRQQVLQSVIAAEPPAPGTIVPGVPAELDKLILRCLRKDRERRLQHISDVSVLLQDIKDDAASGHRAARPAGARAGLGPALAGLALVLALAVGAWLVWRGRVPRPEPLLVPVTTMSGSESYASFSPDATQVAFCWEGEARPQGEAASKDIWIKLVSGMEARRLTSGPDGDWTPSWSPDGTRLAFTRFPPGVNPAVAAGAVFLVSVIGGGERRLGDFPAGFSQLAWSRDGRFVAARRMRAAGETAPEASGIHLLPTDGGAPRPITLPPQPGWDKHPAFSPDGRSLGYASCAGLVTPGCHVLLLELDAEGRPRGAARRLTEQAGPIHGLAWTRDGRSVVYATSGMSLEGTGMGATLWRVRADGKEPPQRIDLAPPGSYAPATTVARDRLLFVHDSADLDVYRFSANGPPEPVMASSAVDYGPRISPDGRRIAVESWRAGTLYKEIWLADVDGSNPAQLTNVTADRENPAAGTGAPFWSPDGRYVVHNREEPSRGPGATNLWVVSVEGGIDRRLTSQNQRAALPVWSRDGFIYYRLPSPGGTDYYRMRATGGEAERVTRHGALMAEASWDGRLLLYSEHDFSGPIFLLDLASGVERKLEDCALSRVLASSQTAFYYVGCAAGPDWPLYRYEPASGRRERLGALTNPNLGLTVSPDGGTILYARANLAGADLMMIENFR
jgi:Tol biopolymer transport system component